MTLGRAMAARNGYTAMQSSDLYPTDGDEIDWMFAKQGIFSFTIELYPAGGGANRWYPGLADRAGDDAQRQRRARPRPQGRLPLEGHRQAAQYCQ